MNAVATAKTTATSTQMHQLVEEEKHLKFYSGTGSHLKEFKNIYFKHIKEFLLQFNFKLNARSVNKYPFFSSWHILILFKK